jgi:peptide deformylase
VEVGVILPIRYYGDPVLRRVARPVRRFDETLRVLAQDMIETMYDANGVGLAAPQVGVPQRLFIALELQPPEEPEEAEAEALTTEQKKRRWGVVAEHVLVNPLVTARSGEQYGQDGCLSVPGLYVAALRRDLQVTVQYQDLTGGTRELTAEGHFAHVIQHELDHLDGIFFFDRLPTAEKQAFFEEHRQVLADLQREAKAFLKHQGVRVT